MIVVPAATPVTMPVVEPIVAMPVDPELHVPPGVGSMSGIIDPTHTTEGPLMAPGEGLTETLFVAQQLPRE